MRKITVTVKGSAEIARLYGYIKRGKDDVCTTKNKHDENYWRVSIFYSTFLDKYFDDKEEAEVYLDKLNKLLDRAHAYGISDAVRALTNTTME